MTAASPLSTPGRTRTARRILAAALSVLLAAGCAPAPASGPRLATKAPERIEGNAGDPTTEPDSGPAWTAPSKDLAWKSCEEPFDTPGVTVSCASLRAPDLATTDRKLSAVTVYRVVTGKTPTSSPPLVVATGPDYPAPSFLTSLSKNTPTLIDSRPIVVVEHRGSNSNPSDCFPPEGRAALNQLGSARGGAIASGNYSDLNSAVTACTDSIMGAELSFGAVGAANDFETLRTTWGVPALALLGVGSGTKTVLEYGASRPERVALMALDSPVPWTGDQKASITAAATGTADALRRWIADCRGPACGPQSPEQRSAGINLALKQAAEDALPVPPNQLVLAIQDALSDISGASTPEASPGDEFLGKLAGQPEDPSARSTIRRRAAELGASTLPIVAGCTDLQERIPVEQYQQFSSEIGAKSGDAAATLAEMGAICSSWPTPPAVNRTAPPAAPILVLRSTSDPRGGTDLLDNFAAQLRAASSEIVQTVLWNAPGSRVILHSPCGQDALTQFLDNPETPRENRACPA